jgi:agmatinase
VAFPDRVLKRNAYEGMTWKQQCAEIIKPLGQNVYISFDIDALDPSLCPHTGTPVPGGLEFEQVFYLFDALIKSGKKIITWRLCHDYSNKYSCPWFEVGNIKTHNHLF